MKLVLLTLICASPSCDTPVQPVFNAYGQVPYVVCRGLPDHRIKSPDKVHKAPAPAKKYIVNKHHHKSIKPIFPAGNRRVAVNYHLKYGHKFKHGYYYKGYKHAHWSHCYWDNRYGTYLYWDRYAKEYYYWHAKHYRYYPVCYAPDGYVFDYVADPLPPAVEAPCPPN